MSMSGGCATDSGLRERVRRLGMWGLASWLVLVLAPAAFAQSARDFGGYPGYAGPLSAGYTTQSLYVSAQDGTKLAIRRNRVITTGRRQQQQPRKKHSSNHANLHQPGEISSPARGRR